MGAVGIVVDVARVGFHKRDLARAAQLPVFFAPRNPGAQKGELVVTTDLHAAPLRIPLSATAYEY